MQSFSRVLVAMLPLVLLPAAPAIAAPAATLQPRLGPVTMAPGGPEKHTLLWVRLGDAVRGTSAALEVTVDLGGATTFADVRIEPGLSLIDRPASGEFSELADGSAQCRRTGEKISCRWVATLPSSGAFGAPADLVFSPRSTAKRGDTATISMAARVGDGPASTATSTVRIGEGVDLASDGDSRIKAAPGRSVRITPTVRNAGATAVDGAVLLVAADPRLLRPTSFRNCRYYAGMICTFGTSLEPGRRYGLSSPVVVRSPADTVPGSVAHLGLEWTTRTEWADAELADLGTPGTGAELTLKPLAAAQDDGQADVAPANNAADITFTVTGTRRPSISAAGSKTTATIGDSRTLTNGAMNFGPGVLRPDLFWNNSLYVRISVPSNVVIEGGTGCDPEAPANVQYCRLTHDLGPGQRASFPIRVRVQSDCGQPGAVEILRGRDDLLGRGKKEAPVTVNVAGATCAAVALPITGPGAGWTALSGLLLLVAGILLTVLGIRRPVYAHAGGETLAGPPSEGRTP